MAFDRHMNLVLWDTEEFRKIKNKKGSGVTEEREDKRSLGLVILRGDSVVSMTIEGPPPPDDDEKLMPGGPGAARPAGRGMPVPGAMAPMGLSGPVRGVGGPAASLMAPPSQGASVSRILHCYCRELFCCAVVAQGAAQQYARPPVPAVPGMPRPPMPMPGMPGMPPGMVPGMPGMPPGMPPGMMMPPRGMPMPPPGAMPMPPRGFPPGPPPPRG